MTRKPRAGWGLLALPAIAVAAAAVSGIVSFSASAGRPVAPRAAPADLGAELYDLRCTSCHGIGGGGVVERGPPLTTEGEASVDFVLRTGRMPLAQPDIQAKRGPVQFNEEEIVALVAYAGAFGDGPGIPDIDITDADVAAGGNLYRLNCAACHVASGSGAAIGGGRNAPSLMEATPTQIGQAVLIGPGAMPVFGALSDQDRNDLAAYVVDLQERNQETVLRNFGGAGPVAEGLAAWLLGLIPLIALTRWIGSPHEGRDEGANPDLDAMSSDDSEVVT